MATIEKRKSDDGDLSYRARIRIRAFTEQTATFSRRTDAKLWAQSTETALRERWYFPHRESQRHTAAQLVEPYCESVVLTKTAQRPQSHAAPEMVEDTPWAAASAGVTVPARLRSSAASLSREREPNSRGFIGYVKSVQTSSRHVIKVHTV